VKRIETRSSPRTTRAPTTSKLGIEGAYRRSWNVVTGSEQVEIDAAGADPRALQDEAALGQQPHGDAGLEPAARRGRSLPDFAGRWSRSTQVGEILALTRNPASIRPLRRWHRSAERDALNNRRQAAQQPRAAGSIRRVDDQALHGARRPRVQEALAGIHDLVRVLFAPGSRAPLTATGRRKQRAGDMRQWIVISCDTYYYGLPPSRHRTRSPLLTNSIRLRTGSTSRRVTRARRLAGVEAQRFSRSGTPATR